MAHNRKLEPSAGAGPHLRVAGTGGARPARRHLRPPNLQRGHRPYMIQGGDREARYARGIWFASRLKRVVMS